MGVQGQVSGPLASLFLSRPLQSPPRGGVQQQDANDRLFFCCSALYQLHLVKAATARAFVPKDLRLVEAFGYTLGGMFLARYQDSPAGQFDEVIPPFLSHES